METTGSSPRCGQGGSPGDVDVGVGDDTGGHRGQRGDRDVHQRPVRRVRERGVGRGGTPVRDRVREALPAVLPGGQEETLRGPHRLEGGETRRRHRHHGVRVHPVGHRADHQTGPTTGDRDDRHRGAVGRREGVPPRGDPGVQGRRRGRRRDRHPGWDREEAGQLRHGHRPGPRGEVRQPPVGDELPVGVETQAALLGEGPPGLLRGGGVGDGTAAERAQRGGRPLHGVQTGSGRDLLRVRGRTPGGVRDRLREDVGEDTERADLADHRLAGPVVGRDRERPGTDRARAVGVTRRRSTGT